jgi:polysaccharide pyruvyl transferase WcaK-like protein
MPPKRRLFLYGYNGFRNIGADCRIMAIVKNLNRLLPETEVVVNSFHPTRMNFVEGARVDYFHAATYPWAARGRIRGSDATVLCEANMLTDEFSPHMAKAFMTAMRQGAKLGVPTYGLAVDSGTLAPRLERQMVEALSTLELITARSAGAATTLREKGVRAPIEITADCAVNMTLPGAEQQRRVWSSLGMLDGPVYGLAPVDFYMFPARISAVGRREEYVRYPFKGTWPDDGRQRSDRLLREWVAHTDYLLSTDRRAKVAIFALDPSDTLFARHLAEAIGRPERTILVVGEDHPALDVSAALGGLRTMTTSRYHGLVLPLCYRVPYIALGHDTRTRFISQELGLEQAFVDFRSEQLVDDLEQRHRWIEEERDDVCQAIDTGFRAMQDRDLDNYRFLGEALARHGHRVEQLAAETI